MEIKRLNRRGFTLIEILVVVLIVGILTTLLIVDFRKGKMRDDLKQGAMLISESLRKVQNLAMTGRLAESSGQSAKGFGIYINKSLSPNEFKIFGDVLNEGYYAPNDDILIEEGIVKLPNNVNITTIEATISPANDPAIFGDIIHIIYKPTVPRPTIWINWLVDDVNSIHIKVIHTITGENKSIRLNVLTGQVEII